MTTPGDPIIVDLADEEETIRFGEDLVLAAATGDCIALEGDLGAGKSTLARAFLRALANDDTLEVPSPTFTLVQHYDLRLPVAHFDLYRIGDGSELQELGFDEALESGVCLVEWPERASGYLPKDLIILRFAFLETGRRVTITGPAGRMERIRRVLAIRAFLAAHQLGAAHRRFLIGDAGTRVYERIYPANGERLILMDAARRPPGMPIKDGKSYPELVHLAVDVHPFIAVDGLLRDKGYCAPAILHRDPARGLLLIEDLGSETIVDDHGQPIRERYLESVRALAHMHGARFERDVETAPGHIHHIPDFDPVAMKTEAELLVEWHIPWKRGTAASDAERDAFESVWDGLIAELAGCERTLLLRDYHSPNIIWRPQAEGLQRIGILDFQDAMIGPSAYDLASIVQDARTTIPPDLADALMDAYLSIRHGQGHFEEAAFLKAFAIMAAQRNCKLNGIWVRLQKRDGKPGYLKHMPRTLGYLHRAMQHASLAPLRDWCARVGIETGESSN